MKMISKNYEKELFDRRAPQRHAYVYGVGGNSNAKQMTVLGKEQEFAQGVKDAVRATYAVVTTEKPVFEILADKRRPGRMIRPTRDGHRLFQAMALPFDDIKATLPNNHFNPLFDLLRNTCERHHADDLLLSSRGVMSEAEAVKILELLKSLVQDLREGWASKEVQKTFDSFRRRSDKRWKAVKTAVRESFEDCAKLLPIRLDLHHHASINDYPFAPTVSENAACDWFVKFTRYLRADHPLVRYIANMEYGTQTGFHFHVLILLNGELARSHVLLAKQMGEHWENVITEGKGRYFNCNANHYANPVLEAIHYSDFAKIEALLDGAAWYPAKTDIWMRYKVTGKSFVISQRYKQLSPGGAKRKVRTGFDGDGVQISAELAL